MIVASSHKGIQNYTKFSQNQASQSQVIPESHPADGYAGSVSTGPAEDFLTLGRTRFAASSKSAADAHLKPAGDFFSREKSLVASPELLADVELRYVDGTKVVVPDGRATAQQLKKTKDGTIDSIRGSGHGHDDRGSASMGLDTNDEGAAGLTATKGSKRPRVTLDVVEGAYTKQLDFGKMLEHKFAPGGARLIELDACDTGDANGLAPTLSKVLPGIRVKGTAGTLLENRLTGAEYPASTPDATRTFVVPRGQAGVTPGSYNPFPIK
ncbi:MAG: hypothetical protein KF760_30195 [Candidatus Eremiobacteraeota bacterium]|nr:hypothetical protein [Candidatus Eremiobacteraeota bacterium]MCW5871693.1 hypothetical protein [Candidatus Eremiobacteraeota bacterium]